MKVVVHRMLMKTCREATKWLISMPQSGIAMSVSIEFLINSTTSIHQRAVVQLIVERWYNRMTVRTMTMILWP